MQGAELHPREIGDTFPRKWERHPVHPHENGDTYPRKWEHSRANHNTFPHKQELFSAKLIQFYNLHFVLFLDS